MEKIITYFLSLSLILIAGCSTKDDRDVITVEKFPQDIAIEGEYLDFEVTAYSCDFGQPIPLKADSQSCFKQTPCPAESGQ